MPGLTHAVLAYEAWVHHNGRRVEGLTVEAYGSMAEFTIVLVQPFTWKGILKKSAVALRAPIVIKQAEPPLFDAERVF
ncbi:hypothetical protein [uncultured Amnibacterium sp.]|uniref:hypothetical protein n=1 Tax=uncultured Amnibacterium sp. TaxID=1631851 RepID=UPI0035CB152C